MHEALAKERFVDPVSAERCFSMVLGARLTWERVLAGLCFLEDAEACAGMR